MPQEGLAMEQERFDRLTRAVAQGTNRRGLIAALSSALVGAGLLATPEETLAAKGKGEQKRYGKGQAPERELQGIAPEATSCARQCRKKSSKQARRRCRKRCQPPIPECTTSADCPSGELCESGVCIPIPDQCAVDTDCDACERCEDGVCVAQCQPEQICRNGQCETVQCTTDTECTGCARCQDDRCHWQCAATEVCLSGSGGTGRCCQPRGCPVDTNCGTVDDGCGGQARCGTCTSPETCGGGNSGTANRCGCTQTTCTAAGAQCGTIGDGCGGTRDCGSCLPCQTCSNGTCIAAPNTTYACDGTALIRVGSAVCTNSGGETGICVDGACSCVSQIYDQASNRCLCRDNPCSINQPPAQCCHVSQICSDGLAGTGCHACP